MSVDFEHAVAANEYGFYCIPTAYLHREMPALLNSGGVYEPDTLKFLRRQLGTGDIATGGAFIGDFFPALSSALAPTARLFSFEPSPLSFDAATETVRLNGLKNIHLSPVAVGAEKGTLPLRIARKDGTIVAAGETLSPDLAMDDSRVIPVEVTTLDTLVPKSRKVSVLHLDVEGFEEQALRGGTRLINDHAPLVMLEAGKPWKWRHFTQVLAEIAPKSGYRFSGEIERNAIFRPDPA